MANSSLASLVVSLEANIAKFVTDMKSASDVTHASMKSIESSASGAKSALESISSAASFAKHALGVVGVGLGVHEIVAWSEGVIGAAANLQKLSAITGSSVESLSRLQNIAVVSGVDIQTLNTAVGKLSAGMAGVDEDSGKAAKALNFLGITTKDPAEAFQQLAEKLNQYEDGIGKAALAKDIFGRGGPQFLQLLKDMANLHGVVATVTKEQAEEAKKLEEQMRLLGQQSTLLKNILLSDLVPALAEAAKNFNLARAAGLGFWEATLHANSPQQTLDTLDNLNAKLVKAQQQLTIASQSTRGDRELMLAGIKAQIREITTDIEKYQKLALSYNPASPTADTQFPKGQLTYSGAKEPKGGHELNAAAAFIAQLDAEYAAQKEAYSRELTQAKQFTDMQIALDRQSFDAREIDQVTFLQRKLEHDRTYTTLSIADAEKEVQAASKRLGALVEVNDTQALSAHERAAMELALIKASTDLTAAEGNLAKVRNAGDIQAINNGSELLKVQNALTDAVRKQKESFDDFLRTLQNQDDEQQFQLTLLGKTADAVEVLTAAHRVELEIQQKRLELEKRLRDLEALGAQADPELVKEVNDQLDRLPGIYDRTVKATVAAKQATISYQNSFIGGWTKAFNDYIASVSAANIAQETFNTLTRSMETLFVDMANHATNAFRKFTDAILQMIVQIAAKLAVSGILQLLGLGGGGFNFNIGGGASGGGGAGGGLNLGNLLNLGSAGSGATSFATSGVGSFLGLSAPTAGFDAAAAGGLSSGLEAGAGSLGLTEFGTLFVAAAPWLAIGAIAVPLVLNYLNSHKGGPMERLYGTSGGDISDYGDFTTTHKLVGTDAVANTQLQQAAATAQGTYEGMVKLLGGKSFGESAFAFYTSRDPKGTASNQLDVRAFVGGKNVYTANVQDQLGRDPAVLAERLKLEASRAVLAALQQSDLPKFIANLINSVEASSATQEQIDNIIAVAGAVKKLVDVAPLLGEAFANLNPADILSLVDAVGGVEDFVQSVQFLHENFTTAADRMSEAQQTLTDGFAQLGIEVPKTHQDFLDLLAGYDLTTEAGRQLYASVIHLGPAFIAVKGTADDAAKALKAQADAQRQSTQSLLDAQLGYQQALLPDTPQGHLEGAQLQLVHDQQRTNTLIQQFIDANPWAKAFADAGGDVGETLTQIQQDDYEHYDPQNQALISEIIRGKTVEHNDLNAIKKATDDVAKAVVEQYNALEARANAEAAAQKRLAASGTTLGTQLVQQYGTLAGQSSGDFGAKTALQIAFIVAELDELQKAAGKKPTIKVAAEIKALQDSDKALTDSLVLFNTLKARYGASIAEQLVNLTKQYQDQAKALDGNVAQLALLNGLFEDQWNAIINGTAEGVDGVQDQLKKLQQSILDYVDSLRISDISPLTPAQKLAEARAQYESDLAKASTGDQKALGDVTGSADAFLKLARDFYASSANYTNIFDQVTGQLTTLGTADLAATTVPMNAADQALLNTLPVGSKIMSAADMQTVVAYLKASGGTVAANTLIPPPPPPPGKVMDWDAIKKWGTHTTSTSGAATAATAPAPIVLLVPAASSDQVTVAPPMNPADQALLTALPTGSKLLSVADFQTVRPNIQPTIIVPSPAPPPPSTPQPQPPWSGSGGGLWRGGNTTTTTQPATAAPVPTPSRPLILTVPTMWGNGWGGTSASSTPTTPEPTALPTPAPTLPATWSNLWKGPQQTTPPAPTSTVTAEEMTTAVQEAVYQSTVAIVTAQQTSTAQITAAVEGGTNKTVEAITTGKK